MVNRKKRPPREFLAIIGDPSRRLDLFIDLLNSADSGKGIDSIRELLRNLKAVENAINDEHFSKPDPNHVGNLFIDSDAQLRARGVSEETIERLAKIRSVFDGSSFKLTPSLLPGEGWNFNLVPKRTGTLVELNRNFLLAIIQGLSATGLLSSIRECPVCGRWFSGRKNKRSCDGPCRKKRYRTSERGKIKKREDMRRFRREQKRRDEEAAHLARSYGRNRPKKHTA
jgi:hypothetical protein